MENESLTKNNVSNSVVQSRGTLSYFRDFRIAGCNIHTDANALYLLAQTNFLTVRVKNAN